MSTVESKTAVQSDPTGEGVLQPAPDGEDATTATDEISSSEIRFEFNFDELVRDIEYLSDQSGRLASNIERQRKKISAIKYLFDLFDQSDHDALDIESQRQIILIIQRLLYDAYNTLDEFRTRQSAIRDVLDINFGVK